MTTLLWVHGGRGLQVEKHGSVEEAVTSAWHREEVSISGVEKDGRILDRAEYQPILDRLAAEEKLEDESWTAGSRVTAVVLLRPLPEVRGGRKGSTAILDWVYEGEDPLEAQALAVAQFGLDRVRLEMR